MLVYETPHQHLLLARALLKNLFVERKQSTKRDHTIVCNSRGVWGDSPAENV
jgi:hypothetical protein